VDPTWPWSLFLVTLKGTGFDWRSNGNGPIFELYGLQYEANYPAADNLPQSQPVTLAAMADSFPMRNCRVLVTLDDPRKQTLATQ
jgi:hypothetical protein